MYWYFISQEARKDTVHVQRSREEKMHNEQLKYDIHNVEIEK
jgi:hypothetical protein